MMLALMGGPLCTVLVAWGFACFEDVFHRDAEVARGQVTAFGRTQCHVVVLKGVGSMTIAPFIPFVMCGNCGAAPQSDVTAAVPSWSEAHEATARNRARSNRDEQANGWPWLAMRCVGLNDELRALQIAAESGADDPRVHEFVKWNAPNGGAEGGIVLDPGTFVGSVPARSAKILPLRPIWFGFAMNSATYAGLCILAVLAGGPFRRGVRARRGQCTKCRYALRGLDRCPECGTEAWRHDRPKK
ncbi:MAG: hypothetical protein JNK53_03825 [Phycisphaerae bacterium]|nr:hypothetical protein [Phycisphaerae bacterium]